MHPVQLLEPSREYDPLEHTLHVLAARPENFPVEHVEQLLEFVLEKLPSLQLRHVLAAPLPE